MVRVAVRRGAWKNMMCQLDAMDVSSVEKMYDVLLHQSVDSRLTNLAKSQTMVKMILIIGSSLRVELAAGRSLAMERIRWAVDRTVW